MEIALHFPASNGMSFFVSSLWENEYFQMNPTKVTLTGVTETGAQFFSFLLSELVAE